MHPPMSARVRAPALQTRTPHGRSRAPKEGAVAVLHRQGVRHLRDRLFATGGCRLLTRTMPSDDIVVLAPTMLTDPGSIAERAARLEFHRTALERQGIDDLAALGDLILSGAVL